MPFRRTHTSRRPIRRRRMPLKRKRTARPVTARFARTVAIKGAEQNTLRINFNEAFATTAIGDAVKAFQIDNIIQGDASNQRIGAKLFLNSLKLNLTIKQNSGTTTDVWACRMFLVRLTTANPLNLTTFANMYQNSSWADETPFFAAGAAEAMSQLPNKEAYQLLWQKKIWVTGTGASVSPTLWYPQVNSNIKLNKVVSYDKLSSSLSRNPIYLIFHFADANNHTGADQTIVQGMASIKYKDY